MTCEHCDCRSGHDCDPQTSTGRWIICPTCDGDGSHSRNLGAITQEDREDWDPDEWESYLSGGYDTQCNTCNGTGKIRNNDESWARHRAQLRSESVIEYGGRCWNSEGEPL